MTEDRAPFSLTVERHLAAAPEAVFRALTEAEAIKRWFAPAQAVVVPLAEVDARVGGRWRVVMQDPTGIMHRVGGTYDAVVPAERLVFTWAWEADPDRRSTVTIQLASRDGGTDVVVVHGGFGEAADRDRHQSGWVGTLERLAAHVIGAAMPFC